MVSASAAAAHRRKCRRLLYLRGGDDSPIRVRDLSTAKEASVASGSELVWSARFDPEGRGLRVNTLASGTWRVRRHGYKAHRRQRSTRTP